MKTLKDIKISTSSTDDIEQMLIEQANLEYTEKLKILAHEWVEAHDKISKDIPSGHNVTTCNSINNWIRYFFNLDDYE